MSRRQSIAERARRLDAQTGEGPDHEANGTATVVGDTEDNGLDPAAEDHMFRSSRPGADGRTADASAGDQDTARTEAEDGPSSRPTKRRDMSEEEPVPEEEDKFPWHFQFDDDEPEELQASSPLLSRAFRASIG